MHYKFKPIVKVGQSIPETQTQDGEEVKYTWKVEAVYPNGAVCRKKCGGSRRFFTLTDLWERGLAIPLVRDPDVGGARERAEERATRICCQKCVSFVCDCLAQNGAQRGHCSITGKKVYGIRAACKRRFQRKEEQNE